MVFNGSLVTMERQSFVIQMAVLCYVLHSYIFKSIVICISLFVFYSIKKHLKFNFFLHNANAVDFHLDKPHMKFHRIDVSHVRYSLINTFEYFTFFHQVKLLHILMDLFDEFD
jgi:hypothetical protein